MLFWESLGIEQIEKSLVRDVEVSSVGGAGVRRSGVTGSRGRRKGLGSLA